MSSYSQKNIPSIAYDKAVDLKRLHFIASNLSAHPPAADTQVLDVGCGNGHISLFLGSLGYDVLGIDVSEKVIDKARVLNTQANVRFEVVSAETLSTLHTHYSIIICSEVLEHLSTPEDTLHAIARLLKKDGVLFVTVPNGKGPREVLVTQPMQKLHRHPGMMLRIVTWAKKMMGYSGKTVQSDADDLEHVQFFSKPDLLSLASRTGFSVSKFEHADCISDVFPFSFFFKKSKMLQKIDCKMADRLPSGLTSGFHTLWVKRN